MRPIIAAALVLLSVAPSAVYAQSAPAPAAASTHYTTADTDIGTLLDDPAAKAVIDKHLPALTKNENINMARSMTLKAIQQYSPDVVTDAALAAIDVDLAKLPAKK